MKVTLGTPPPDAMPVIERMIEKIGKNLQEIVREEPLYPEAAMSAFFEVVFRMASSSPSVMRSLKEGLAILERDVN